MASREPRAKDTLKENYQKDGNEESSSEDDEGDGDGKGASLLHKKGSRSQGEKVTNLEALRPVSRNPESLSGQQHYIITDMPSGRKTPNTTSNTAVAATSSVAATAGATMLQKDKQHKKCRGKNRHMNGMGDEGSFRSLGSSSTVSTQARKQTHLQSTDSSDDDFSDCASVESMESSASALAVKEAMRNNPCFSHIRNEMINPIPAPQTKIVQDTVHLPKLKQPVPQDARTEDLTTHRKALPKQHKEKKQRNQQPQQGSHDHRQSSWWKNAFRGRPSVARLSLRGSPCACRLLFQKHGEKHSQLHVLLQELRKRGPSAGFIDQLFVGSPSPMQIFFGYYCKCTRKMPSLAQLFLMPQAADQTSLLEICLATLRDSGSGSECEQDRIDREIILKSLTTSTRGVKSLISVLLEGEENIQNPKAPRSLLRLFLSGKPSLASLVLDRRNEQPRTTLSVLRVLLDGELTEGDSLARMMVTEPRPCSLIRFLLLGEDQSKPSLLRLFLNNTEDQDWLVIPTFERWTLINRLMRPHAHLNDVVARPMRRWVRENSLLSAGFVELFTVVVQLLANLMFELTLPGVDGSSAGNAVRLLCLGNESTVQPIYRVVFWRSEAGLFEIPTLAMAGIAAGLRIKAAPPGQQHVMLRWWQNKMVRTVSKLELTAHKSSEWAQTLIRTAQALAPGGLLEVRFVEIAMAIATPDMSRRERVETILTELFAGLETDTALAAVWDVHVGAVLTEVTDPGVRKLLHAVRSRDWQLFVDLLFTLNVVEPPSLVTVFHDLETLVHYAIDMFKND